MNPDPPVISIFMRPQRSSASANAGYAARGTERALPQKHVACRAARCPRARRSRQNARVNMHASSRAATSALSAASPLVPAASATHLAAERFVVVVRNGPAYDLSDQLEYHAELLSRLAPGLVLTNGPVHLTRDVGRVRVECVPCRDVGATRLDKARYVARATRTAVRAIRASGRPGLVVSYDPFVSGTIARLVRAATGAPFICELNGAFGNADNFADLPAKARDAARTRMLRFATWTLRSADGIRLLFDAQLDGVDLRGHRPPVRSYFDPVPLDRFEDLGEQPYVLFVGHPFRRKGVDVLMRAFARVRDAHPEWRLVLVGHELEHHCASAEVSMERIEIRRPTKNAALAPLIGRCGIFVLPSRSEAMGRVLLEAAAACKPRIGSDVDGIPTVIAHDIDGLLVPKEDVEALAASLSRLMGSPALRARFGATARTRVLAEFSGERYLQLFSGLANEVLAASGAR
jgi:glycosyltransferase involved in cell wall biosynthesis